MSKQKSDESMATVVTEKPAQPLVVEPMLSFDRWFATTGKPAHHKLGMLAFIKGRSTGKRTKSSWDEMFKGY